MLIAPIEINQTASGGAWSFNTLKISGAYLSHILVVAAAVTTTFNVTITDEKSNIIYAEDGITGTLREEVYIPLRGIYTIAVDTSSVADSTFTGRLMLEE